METKIEFQTNIPVPLKLRFANGREVASRFKEENEVMYSTQDGRAFYVSLGASRVIADQLAEKGITAGEPIEITKAEVHQPGGRKTTQWRVARVLQRDGTLVVPGAAKASARTPAPASAATTKQQHANNGNGSNSANGNGNHHPPDASQQPAHVHVAWAQLVLGTANALVDVYASALSYARQRHGEAVKPEDVRALVTTAFIAATKNGGPNVT